LLAAVHNRQKTLREWRSAIGEAHLQSIPLIRVPGDRAEFIRCPETGIPLEIHENCDGSFSALPPADSELDSRIDGLQLADLLLYEIDWQALLRKVQRQYHISGQIRSLNINPQLWNIGLTEGFPVCFAVLNSLADAESVLPFLQTAPTPRLLLPTASDKIFSSLTRAGIQFQVLDSTPLAAFPVLENKPASLYRIVGRDKGWCIIFDGAEEVFPDMKGMQIIAHLLKNPPHAPIHVLELESAVQGNRPLCQSHIVDDGGDDSGEDYDVADHEHSAPLSFSDRLQELNLNMDSKEIDETLLRERSKYKKISEDPKASKKTREDAQTKIAQIDSFRRTGGPKHVDQPSKAYDRVRQQFNRILRKLNSSQSQSLKSFAEHLQKQLLEPSRRYSGTSRSRVKAGVAQTFTYEPPPGVIWTD
jgi:hypothetical protein